ncbi:alpha-ketoglutarate-dependent dioxygenase AlkB [Rubellimicrobium rubrum]|uniref:Alpha-ketoglutarate-dependent dioxygenase AlkB n=1 Tax=Rubellimicrobium rubrum TaxID=2585369 RepID=A0A5C4MM70_9RHOB|nr:alpha-ketoglutarate-dependent dioxygenase AlkB [Rubellimicrobium rubrum]TNC46424.1 alpha-ketoglutarate-dependent dioxygenase AlkB [Rubellimicrobium rubrum]
MRTMLDLRGVRVWPGFLSRPEQDTLLAGILSVMEAAPPFHPVTRWGKAMSVAMTSAGRFGWFSDRRGYRYEERHPSGQSWPPIPDAVLRVWEAVAPDARAPECCLINLYRSGARMGLHQDRDEADLSQPVVSISLGDEALFRVGALERGGSTESVWLRSGDVAVIGGSARLVHHGIDRVRDGSSDLIPGGGRINLTLRVVT